MQANITTKSRRGEYPELPELANSVALILSLRADSRIHFQVARQVVKGAVWWASNKIGRDYASPYWTQRAIEHRKTNPKWVKGNGLVNEHVIPRTLIENRLLRLPVPPCKEILGDLRLSFTCLVHAEEDRAFSGRLRTKMPEGWSWGDDPFARYVAANVPWSTWPDA